MPQAAKTAEAPRSSRHPASKTPRQHQATPQTPIRSSPGNNPRQPPAQGCLAGSPKQPKATRKPQAARAAQAGPGSQAGTPGTPRQPQAAPVFLQRNPRRPRPPRQLKQLKATPGNPKQPRKPKAAETAQAGKDKPRQPETPRGSPKQPQFFLHFSVRFCSLFSVSFLSWAARIELRLSRIKTVSNSFSSTELQPDPSYPAKAQNSEK